MTTRAVLRKCSRRGRLPDFQLDVPAGAVDASRQMDRLAESRPAAVLIIAGAEGSARLVRALRASLDWGLAACTLFGSHVMGRTRFLELAGPAANGVCFPRLGAANPTDAGWARFTQRFQAERGRAPDYAAVMTYDATRLLIDAIRARSRARCAPP